MKTLELFQCKSERTTIDVVEINNSNGIMYLRLPTDDHTSDLVAYRHESNM
jgi:hypothetical protein